MADNRFNHVGLGNAGSYQVSGFPWITGSSAELATATTVRHRFPFVSKSITLINTNTNNGEDLRLHFVSGTRTAITEDGIEGAQTCIDWAAGSNTNDVHAGFHYITVPAGNASVTLNVKCAEFYISNISGNNDLKYEVFAELTRIPVGRMPHLTGSGQTDWHGRIY